MVKNPPPMWETWVRSLGWEDPLEDGMATHSSDSCLEKPHSQEKPGGLQPIGLHTTERLSRLCTHRLTCASAPGETLQMCTAHNMETQSSY